jgi:ribonuclease P protein component
LGNIAACPAECGDAPFIYLLLLSHASNIKPRFTFPKAEHLKSRKAIEQLFKTGKSFFVRPYKVFYQMVDEISQQSIVNGQPSMFNGVPLSDNEIPTPGLPTANYKPPTVPLQAGFAVSTRNFKHAVDRNRVKRIGREAYRLNKQPLMNKLAESKTQLQVFFVYTDKTLPNFTEAEAKMKICLEKLMTIIHK